MRAQVKAGSIFVAGGLATVILGRLGADTWVLAISVGFFLAIGLGLDWFLSSTRHKAGFAALGLAFLCVAGYGVIVAPTPSLYERYWNEWGYPERNPQQSKVLRRWTALVTTVGKRQYFNPGAFAPALRGLSRVRIYLTFPMGLVIDDPGSWALNGGTPEGGLIYWAEVTKEGPINGGEGSNGDVGIFLHATGAGTYQMKYTITSNELGPASGRFSITAVDETK